MSVRAAKTRFRRRMRVVGEICDELRTLLYSLPTPDKEDMDDALSPIGGLTIDLHFMGALHAVHFLLSEAKLVADEDGRFARSRAESFVVHHRVMKGLENVARMRCRLPPINADEEKTEGDLE